MWKMGTHEMSVENGHTCDECGKWAHMRYKNNEYGNRVTHCRVRAEMSDHEDSSKGGNA